MRAELKKSLSNANIEKNENDNLKYKNLDAHVLSLLRILELELKTSLIYSFKNISNNLCSELRLHDVKIFDFNKYRQRDRICLSNINTHRIRDITDWIKRSAEVWLQNICEQCKASVKVELSIYHVSAQERLLSAHELRRDFNKLWIFISSLSECYQIQRIE